MQDWNDECLDDFGKKKEKMNRISQLRCQDYGNGPKKIQKIEVIWYFRIKESQLNWVIDKYVDDFIV